VAAGISEALITTASGLVIALFAVIPYNVFLSMSEQIELEVAEASSELVDTIATRRGLAERAAEPSE
jgi:biopolymer transport protein ExbB/biopolymer transport protein TolQ